jgi:kynurenine formamidase
MADVSTDEFDSLRERLSNWGRWGDDDELGTVNLISAESVVSAALEIKSGRVFSPSIPLGPSGPQRGNYGRFNPIHLMLRDGGDAVSGAFIDQGDGVDKRLRGTDDIVIMPLQCGTHWDALSHIIHVDTLYNGVPASAVSSSGAKRNSIDRLGGKLVGRGVLLDIPRAKDRAWLNDGEGISSDDLDLAVERQRVELRAGDIVLVRTGQIARTRAEGDWGDYAGGPAPGLDLRSVEWFHRNDVAAVATDTFAAEVRPNETEDVLQPFHLVGIVHMGLTIGEVFDLEELAADCAVDGRYSFFFVGPPLPFEGAVGAPVNPVAIK